MAGGKEEKHLAGFAVQVRNGASVDRHDFVAVFFRDQALGKGKGDERGADAEGGNQGPVLASHAKGLGRRERGRKIGEGTADAGQVRVSVGLRGLKAFVAELSLQVADVAIEVGAVGVAEAVGRDAGE